MAIFRDFGHKARQSGAPATVAIVVLLILCFVGAFGTQTDILSPLMFGAQLEGLMNPAWTLLTYPFYSPGDGRDFFWFVLILLWLWGIGGSVERDLRAATYVAVWLVATLIGALGLWLGCVLLNRSGVIWGGLIPISTLTVIWGTRNPTALVQMMLVLPITGRWLAWLTAGIAIVGVASLNKSPMLGAFASLPLLVGYLYASNLIPRLAYGRSGGGAGGRIEAGRGRMVSKQYLDDVKKREKERDERDRLRRLFENSLDDKPEDDR